VSSCLFSYFSSVTNAWTNAMRRWPPTRRCRSVERKSAAAITAVMWRTGDYGKIHFNIEGANNGPYVGYGVAKKYDEREEVIARHSAQRAPFVAETSRCERNVKGQLWAEELWDLVKEPTLHARFASRSTPPMLGPASITAPRLHRGRSFVASYIVLRSIC
jgi:hypothetical protein